MNRKKSISTQMEMGPPYQKCMSCILLVVEKTYSSREYLRIFEIPNLHAISLYDIELGFFSSALLSTSFASQVH